MITPICTPPNFEQGPFPAQTEQHPGANAAAPTADMLPKNDLRDIIPPFISNFSL